MSKDTILHIVSEDTIIQVTVVAYVTWFGLSGIGGIIGAAWRPLSDLSWYCLISMLIAAAVGVVGGFILLGFEVAAL